MPKSHIPKHLKKLVAARANHRCEYCKAPKAYAPSPFNTDHIVPEILGGSSDFDNLAFSCENCNGHKQRKTHDKDPQTGDLVPLFNPRKDKWSEHFTWRQNSVLVVGITPVGRATVKALHLNHSAVVGMRKLLQSVGEHPPVE